MKLELDDVGAATVVRVFEANVDARVAMEFRTLMAREITAGKRRLALDLREVDFMDSSGLGAVVSVLKALQPDGDLVVFGLRGPVLRLFQLTRMDRVFRLLPDEAAALEALAMPGEGAT